jgi:decaprenyl-phosphate phosphoribosyltransferase
MVRPSSSSAAEQHSPIPDRAPVDGGGRLLDYVRIARPDHWIKNIFVLPGFAVALAVAPHGALSAGVLTLLLICMASVCLTASANYTINEYLDAADDRHHPLKQTRPGARGVLDLRFVCIEYIILAAGGLLLAGAVGLSFLICELWLLAMGIAYNVPPVRTKDRAYLDVLSESVNNPIRFLLGWFVVVPDLIPPASALLAYWMGGAFLMTVKRYAEYRRIGDPGRATLYRRSFGHYTENSLLLSAFFYAMCSAFFIGIFLIKYRIGLVLTFPLFAALFTWYLAIGLRRDSVAQAPEKLYREVSLLAFVCFTFLVTVVLFFFEVPALNVLTETQLIRLP